MEQVRCRAGGLTIFRTSSPTRIWELMSRTPKRWSPSESLNSSHVEASIGKSGVTYMPSMGRCPTLMPFRYVPVLGQRASGCFVVTASRICKSGPMSISLNFPLVISSLASIKMMSRSPCSRHSCNKARRSWSKITRGQVRIPRSSKYHHC